MTNIEKLKSRVKCKAYLQKDKFSDDGYWLIGKYHDCEGLSFADAMFNYFEQQYWQLSVERQESTIKEVCDEYDGIGLAT